MEKWTVMVYLAGDNNLTDESVYSLTEMKKVDTGDRVRVIAQLDPRGSRIPTHRYVINQGQGGSQNVAQGESAGQSKLADDIVRVEEGTVKFYYPNRRLMEREARAAGIEETDTGSPKTLFDFISWSTEHYRADHYMVILAGHGAGTEEDFLLRDENPTNSLSVRELQAVFKAVKELLKIEIDILGMDVCLMSMAEICYQLNGLVKHLVSSESYSPTAGWPYQQILAALDEGLRSKQGVTAGEVATAMVGEFVNFYSDYVVGGLSVDQSALKVEASKRLVETVRTLATTLGRELSKPAFRDAIVLAHWEAQSYNGELFVDLYDFCNLLGQRYPDGGVPEACEAVKKVITDELVLRSCFSGVDNQYSHGVSIYFPWSEVAPYYQFLEFAEATDWDRFLKAYVKATRRLPRGFHEGSNILFDFTKDKPFKFSSVALGGGRFRKADERKTEERATGNLIHSMRNPPITLAEEGLSDCLREKEKAVKRLKQFSAA